jgi:hypothetical protein
MEGQGQDCPPRENFIILCLNKIERHYPKNNVIIGKTMHGIRCPDFQFLLTLFHQENRMERQLMNINDRK